MGETGIKAIQTIERFEEWPALLVALAGVLLIAAIGFLDYLTGYGISLSAFYILPVFILSWGLGRWGALGGGLACAAARTLADFFSGVPHSNVLIFTWNATMRLIIYLLIGFLITILKQHAEHQKTLARIDHLTGAANKRAFGEILKAEAARSRRYQRPFTLAYLDVDDFKTVNDTLGHNVGDQLLQSVVATIRANIRASDTVARLGGDEFALLLPETDEQGARCAISKIQAAFAREMSCRGWPVTASVGSLTCTDHAGDIERLIGQVDALMYAVKMRGKNSAQYTTASGERADTTPSGGTVKQMRSHENSLQ